MRAIGSRASGYALVVRRRAGSLASAYPILLALGSLNVALFGFRIYQKRQVVGGLPAGAWEAGS